MTSMRVLFDTIVGIKMMHSFVDSMAVYLIISLCIFDLKKHENHL